MLRRSYTWCTLILAQTNHRNTYWNCNWDGTPSRPLSWPWLRRWSGEPRLQLERRRMDDLLDCEILRDIARCWWGILDSYGPMDSWMDMVPVFWKYQHISALLFAWDIFGSFLKTWLCALTLCHLKIFLQKQGMAGSPRFAGPGSRNK